MTDDERVRLLLVRALEELRTAVEFQRRDGVLGYGQDVVSQTTFEDIKRQAAELGVTI